MTIIIKLVKRFDEGNIYEDMQDQFYGIREMMGESRVAFLIFAKWYLDPFTWAPDIYNVFNNLVKNLMSYRNVNIITDGDDYPYVFMIRTLINGNATLKPTTDTFIAACIIMTFTKLKRPNCMKGWDKFENQMNALIHNAESMYKQGIWTKKIEQAIGKIRWEVPLLSEDTDYIYWKSHMDNSGLYSWEFRVMINEMIGHPSGLDETLDKMSLGEGSEVIQ